MILSARSSEPAVARLSQRYLNSEAFDRLHAAVMQAVEECARYLDGQGRIDRQKLSPADQNRFMRHSMDLTTNSMRTASILLVWQAVRMKQMTFEEAAREITRTDVTNPTECVEAVSHMPKELNDLVDTMRDLRERTLRLNRAVLCENPSPPSNPVHQALNQLRCELSVTAAN